MLRLLVSEIQDRYSQENFKRIQNFVTQQPILRAQWLFFDNTFQAAVTNARFRHNLKTIPIDVIQTHKTGAGALTWEYNLFDRDFFYISTTGACRVRAFLGRFEEGSNA